MKILILDIETSPHMGFHWGLFQQNISIGQLIESSTVLCWAAKWLDKKKTFFSSIYDTTPKKMIKEIHELINEADAIITYNGKRFDMPTLNKEFLIHKLPPPSSYKDIDLLTTARGKFRFASNKLDYVAQLLGIGMKTSHEGMPLWIECMAKNPKAWKLMKKYNIKNYIRYNQDVKTSIANLEGKMWDEYAREELIIKFLPLVENLARKFSSTQQASGVLSINDLIQDGNKGLVLAVDRLDWNMLGESEDIEKTLKSFFSKRIKGSIRRAIDINRGDIRIPEHLSLIHI